MSQRYGLRPSDVLGIEDRVLAFVVDYQTAIAGLKLEADAIRKSTRG